MLLNNIFNVWRSPEVINNIICDDKKTVSYLDAITLVSKYIKWIDANVLRQPVVFCCEQSVEHGLFLVALYFSGINYIITPSTAIASLIIEDALLSSTDSILLNFEENKIASPELVSVNTKTEIKFNDGLTRRVMFKTSGSLGNPKTVIHDSELLLHNSNSVLLKLPINSNSRILIPVPISHMYGYGAALWPALLVGSNIMITSNVNLLKILEIERVYKPDVMFSTPSTINALTRENSRAGGYRFIVSAGDCINLNNYKAVKRKFNMIFNLYGSTELGVVAIGEVKEDDGEVNGIVNAMPGVEFKIKNNELWIKHLYGFYNYFNKHQRESYFNTNDLAITVSESSFRILGRSDLSINREGRLISFSDVEMLISRLSYIREVVITCGESDNKGSKLLAFCKIDCDMTGIQIKKELSSFIPAYAMPSQVTIVSELPKLSNGKIDRRNINSLTELKAVK